MLLLGALALPGCSAGRNVHDFFLGNQNAPPPHLTGFIGGVAADEPRAALVARNILAAGGNAADAAVALGFALSVTLPSRASLGAGGACLAYTPDPDSPGDGKPEAILFNSVPPAPKAGTDRPAAVPMLARGLFALHARHGSRPFESLVSPAEELARFGVDTSRALAEDISQVAGPLADDDAAASVFAPGGHALRTGARLIQPDLGATLAQLRVAGVGDLYQGTLAHQFAQASARAGGPVTVAELRAALPGTASPVILAAGHDQAAFLPVPADGGLAAAVSFQALQAKPGDLAGAEDRGLSAAARWRKGGVTPAAILAATLAEAGAHPAPDTPDPVASLGALPASTSFVVADRRGNAVACAISMNNLFGTGRIAPGTGIVLAASPDRTPRPLLAAAIAWNTHLHAFRAAVAGSGQQAASIAVADGLAQTLRGQQPIPRPVPNPGRVNVLGCPRYLPDHPASCHWATDPRGAGLAVGGD